MRVECYSERSELRTSSDEGGDGVDVSEEVPGPAGAPGDVPGSDCSPLCPAQSPQQRFGFLAAGHAHQQPRPPASNNKKKAECLDDLHWL